MLRLKCQLPRRVLSFISFILSLWTAQKLLWRKAGGDLTRLSRRWQRYLVSAHLVDDDGEATLALARARAAHRVPQVPHAEGAS